MKALRPAPREVLDVDVFDSLEEAILKTSLKWWEDFMNTSPESEFVPGSVRLEATDAGYLVTGVLKGRIHKVDFGMEVML